jgi:hypothetical protein
MCISLLSFLVNHGFNHEIASWLIWVFEIGIISETKLIKVLKWQRIFNFIAIIIFGIRDFLHSNLLLLNYIYIIKTEINVVPVRDITMAFPNFVLHTEVED